MKKINFLLLCLTAGLSPFLHSEEKQTPTIQRRGPRLQTGGDRNGQRSQPVIDYLQKLKATNPEEFNRLEKLRQEDPQAFRNELRKNAWGRQQGGKFRQGLQAHPLQAEIEKIRSAQTEAEKEAAIADLRLKVSERIAENQKEREEAIEKIRRKLKQLEEQNEQEKIRREEIIDHHLQRILNNLPPSSPNE
ncbi:hypothetical protein P0Y35_02465 [Kiritimatiellaeota bacterium B1221]|nr:hypothetical protein [Kiritimatiellaeota bacterium B1221]